MMSVILGKFHIRFPKEEGLGRTSRLRVNGSKCYNRHMFVGARTRIFENGCGRIKHTVVKFSNFGSRILRHEEFHVADAFAFRLLTLLHPIRESRSGVFFDILVLLGQEWLFHRPRPFVAAHVIIENNGRSTPSAEYDIPIAIHDSYRFPGTILLLHGILRKRFRILDRILAIIFRKSSLQSVETLVVVPKANAARDDLRLLTHGEMELRCAAVRPYGSTSLDNIHGSSRIESQTEDRAVEF
mmetsp:Transcript_7905/g.11629  ORF Transcript_7905/g.11629 Transcript_7905/m.11629 type:complete len:242 (-) Transcript_7905:363-1088(-)